MNYALNINGATIIGVVACCKSKEEATRARRYKLGKMEGSYLLPGTKEKPNSSDRGREELVSSQISPLLIFQKPTKRYSLGPHLFIQKPPPTSLYQVKNHHDAHNLLCHQPLPSDPSKRHG